MVCMEIRYPSLTRMSSRTVPAVSATFLAFIEVLFLYMMFHPKAWLCMPMVPTSRWELPARPAPGAQGKWQL